jgi:hypothetical protein
MLDAWNSHTHDITKSILRDGVEAAANANPVDISLAYNTINKGVESRGHILGIPHFSSVNRSLKAKERPKTGKKEQRTLSIVDNEKWIPG